MNETATAPPAAAEASPAQSSAPAAAPTQGSTQGTTAPTSDSSFLGSAGAPAPAPETAAPADGAAPVAAEAAAPAAITPTVFTDFTLPDGVPADAPLVSSFKETASTLGLSQDQAQALLSKVGPEFSTQVQGMLTQAAEQWAASQRDAWAAVNERWLGEIKAEFGDDKISATLVKIGRVFDDFVGAQDTQARKDLQQALLLTGADKNPALFRLLARVSEHLTEGQHVAGAPSRASFDPASMFPKSVNTGG